MFYYLKGTVVHTFENFAVLDIGGIGFKIYSSLSSLSKITQNNNYIFYTYTNIREDAFDVYGFITQDELNFFEMLLSVSGVGPKAALAVLSALSPSGVATAVLTNDAKAISAAQGVGIKTAQRIILELQSKISGEDLLQNVSENDNFLNMSANNDAVAALMALGYNATEAKRAIAAAEPGKTVEETITNALLKLSKPF
mgnify:FL=1